METPVFGQGRGPNPCQGIRLQQLAGSMAMCRHSSSWSPVLSPLPRQLSASVLLARAQWPRHRQFHRSVLLGPDGQPLANLLRPWSDQGWPPLAIEVAQDWHCSPPPHVMGAGVVCPCQSFNWGTGDHVPEMLVAWQGPVPGSAIGLVSCVCVFDDVVLPPLSLCPPPVNGHKLVTVLEPCLTVCK